MEAGKEGCIDHIWGEAFPEPYNNFNWTQNVSGISADFGNETTLLQDNLYEEKVGVSWKQGAGMRDISVVRYVKRKKEK